MAPRASRIARRVRASRRHLWSGWTCSCPPHRQQRQQSIDGARMASQPRNTRRHFWHFAGMAAAVTSAAVYSSA